MPIPSPEVTVRRRPAIRKWALTMSLCKRSGRRKAKTRGEVAGKEKRVYSKMPALKEDSGHLVTKTASRLGIPPAGYIDMRGGAEQRKGEVGQAIPEKHASRRLACFRDRSGSRTDATNLSQVTGPGLDTA